MKRFKTFILTAMIMCLMGTSIINAYEAEEPLALSYEKVDSDGDGIEDSIAIVYDESYTSANSIIIPEEIEDLSVTELSEYAFVDSELVSIELPDSLEKIGNGAFMFCGNLKNVEVPESVKYICENAFNSCTAAESIKILNPECEIYDSYFTMFQFTGTIYGYENSTAQEYAEKYDYNFAVIETEPEVTSPSVTTAVTTSEDVVTTVSQTETSVSEEGTVSQIETSVSQVTTSEVEITAVSQASSSAETTISIVTTPEITKRTDEHGNSVSVGRSNNSQKACGRKKFRPQ